MLPELVAESNATQKILADAANIRELVAAVERLPIWTPEMRASAQGKRTLEALAKFDDQMFLPKPPKEP